MVAASKAASAPNSGVAHPHGGGGDGGGGGDSSELDSLDGLLADLNLFSW